VSIINPVPGGTGRVLGNTTQSVTFREPESTVLGQSSMANSRSSGQVSKQMGNGKSLGQVSLPQNTSKSIGQVNTSYATSTMDFHSGKPVFLIYQSK